jgi:hypothetical protein
LEHPPSTPGYHHVPSRSGGLGVDSLGKIFQLEGDFLDWMIDSGLGGEYVVNNTKWSIDLPSNFIK